MKRQSRSFEIALAALVCAVGAVSLTLGSFVDFLLAMGYMIAVFALMVLLTKRLVRGYLLAYVGMVILAFLFTGFAMGIFQLLPFVAFFGLHPLANWLQREYTKKKPLHLLWFILKAVWFDLSLWLAWIVLQEFLGLTQMRWYAFVEENFFLLLFVGGTLVFAVYDYMIFLCQRAADGVMRRLRR